MEIQEVKDSNMAWSYLCQEFKLAGYWQERIHGGSHVTEVLRFATSVAESSNVHGLLAECLLIAAKLHDLGRLGMKHHYSGVSKKVLQIAVDKARIDKTNPDYVDHAHLSANLFRLMPIEYTTEFKHAVEWAIRNHSVGLVGLGIKKAEILADQTLGLLVFADHCGDAASPGGVARAAKALEGKVPILSKKHSIEHLQHFLDDPNSFIPVQEAGSYKNESLIAHLVYNYQASRPIITVVRHLLSDEYLESVFYPSEDRYKFIIQSYLTAMQE